MPSVDVSHQVITLPSEDEAESLAGYLTEHGVFAFVTDKSEVRVATPDADAFGMIGMLRQTWSLFWEHSDSGLFGLPLFIKES